MSRLLVLELNDFGLGLAGDPALDGLPPSPGLAVIEPEGIVSGEAAARSARLHPRSAHRAIWSELSTLPLPRPFPQGASTADLAYAHLSQLWSAAGERLGSGAAAIDGVLLAAPGSFTGEELGLVLGIAKGAGVPITGIVDAAVAASSSAAGGPGRALHLDLELGRAVVTEIERGEDGSVARRRVRIEKLAGWNALLDLWAREVGKGFVGATRFDPLHTAGSEQELYDRLPAWLERLTGESSIEAVMGAADREHRVLLSRGQIAGAAATLYDRIVGGARALGATAEAGLELLLSHRLARAPGLLERLGGGELGVSRLMPAGAAAAGALAHAAAIHRPREPSLPRITRLQAGGQPAASAESAAGSAGETGA